MRHERARLVQFVPATGAGYGGLGLVPGVALAAPSLLVLRVHDRSFEAPIPPSPRF